MQMGFATLEVLLAAKLAEVLPRVRDRENFNAIRVHVVPQAVPALKQLTQAFIAELRNGAAQIREVLERAYTALNGQ